MKRPFDNCRVLLACVLVLGSAQVFPLSSVATEVDIEAMPIKLEKTRIYLNKDKRRAYVTVCNEGKMPVMMSAVVQQTTDTPTQTEKAAGMIVNPPNKLLIPNRSEVLRLVLLDDHLPVDRETLFYLRLKFVPARKLMDKTEEYSSVESMMTLYTKVFVRPTQIEKENAGAEACRHIEVAKTSEGVLLTNSSPYWITIPQFVLDNRELPRGIQAPMLAPFGHLNLPYEGEKLSFYCVTEGGRYTEDQTRRVR